MSDVPLAHKDNRIKDNMLVKHNKMVVFKTPRGCDQCGKKTNNTREYSKHMQSAHQEEVGHYECDQCKYLSYDENEVIGHMISKGHQIKKDICVKCPLCTEEFAYGPKLVEHVTTTHQELNATADSTHENEEIQITYDVEEDNNVSVTEESEIIVTYEEEDEEDFKLPPQYISRFYPEDSEEAAQVTYTSIQKSMLFGKATENLRKMMKRGTTIKIKNTEIEFLTENKKDNVTESTVKVNDEDGSGTARLKIWGPKPNSKRNKTTVQITKMEGQNTEFVGKLAKNIVQPLLEHLQVNVNAKGLLKETQDDRKAENKTKKEKGLKNQGDELNPESCDTCGLGLKSMRSLRRHKRQEHIENEPLAGTKRKSTNTNTNVLNPRLADPTNSPPPKLRVVREEAVVPQLGTNMVEATRQNKKIKDLEDIIKRMNEEKLQEDNIKKNLQHNLEKLKEEKLHDDNTKKILQEDLQKANEFVVKILEQREVKQNTVEVTEQNQEEFLTDSEEERVNRNQNKGRSFLKATRGRKPKEIKIYNCPSCEYKTENKADLEEHSKRHQSDLQVLLENKSNGFRRTTPVSQPDIPPKKPEIDTLCHICALRCQNRDKLKTHMKNHTEQGQTYDMSSLQRELDPSTVTKESHQPAPTTPNGSTGTNCRKCGKLFSNLDDLNNHLSNDHKSHRPCKNFSAIPEDNKCTWNERCGFNHTVLKPGTWLCWDCGTTLQNRNDLMIHRKKEHKVPECKKFKSEKACDKSDEICWYLHTKQPASTNENVIIVNDPQQKSDFCQDTNKRTIPISDMNQEAPMKAMMIEMMKMITNQNHTIMKMMKDLQEK